MGYVIILIALDQLSKYLTISYLKPIDSVVILDGIISLTYAENTGAAFSMLEGKIGFFAIVTFLALGLMFYFYKTNTVKHIIGKISLVLVSAGAIGNLIDRISYGYVVDMFEFTFFKFAIFNVADIFITVGGAFLMIYMILFYDKDHKEDESKETGNE